METLKGANSPFNQALKGRVDKYLILLYFISFFTNCRFVSILQRGRTSL